MEEQTKKCPFCGQEINAMAIKCRFCGKWLDGNARNEGPEYASNPKLHSEEPQQAPPPQYTQQGPQQQQYGQQAPPPQYTQQGPQQQQYGQQVPPPQYTQQGPPPQYGGPQPSYQNVYIEQPVRRTNGLGVAGFVLALLSLFLGWIPLLGWIIWFLGILFSFIGIFRKPRGLAVAGLVISLIGIIVILLITGGLTSVVNEVLNTM